MVFVRYFPPYVEPGEVIKYFQTKQELFNLNPMKVFIKMEEPCSFYLNKSEDFPIYMLFLIHKELELPQGFIIGYKKEVENLCLEIRGKLTLFLNDPCSHLEYPPK